MNHCKLLALICLAVVPYLSLAQTPAPPAAVPGPTNSVAGLDTSKLLRKTFWIIETRGVPGAMPGPEMMRKHLERQMEIEKAGILFAAGPVMGGDAPYGMIVVRAGSREEAQKIADGDPLHAGKFRTYTLKQWMVNEGRVSVKLNFSNGTYIFE